MDLLSFLICSFSKSLSKRLIGRLLVSSFNCFGGWNSIFFTKSFSESFWALSKVNFNVFSKFNDFFVLKFLFSIKASTGVLSLVSLLNVKITGACS
jgi:hypothetical protein